MARTRSAPSSNSGGGEVKTPLIVALVFFVLATIILGVTTYLGYTEKGEAVTAAEADKKTATDRSKEKDELAEELAVYAVAMGTATEAQKTAFQNPRFKDKSEAAYNTIMTRLGEQIKEGVTDQLKTNPAIGTNFTVTAKEVFDWEYRDPSGTVGLPKKTIIGSLVSQVGSRELAVALQQQSEKSYKELQNVTNQAIAEMRSTTATAKKQTEDLPNRILKEVEKVEKEKQDAVKKFTADADGFNDKQKQFAAEKQALEFNNKRLQERSNLLVDRAERAETKLSANEDPFMYDKPHGKITMRKDKTLEINLGSADNVKEGLRFSVQPSDTVQRGLGSRLRQTRMEDGSTAMRIVSKGSIEIVEILGPNLSSARISEETDEIRDRILTGDLLYNSAWRKGASDHVALVGIFDMDADGVDDIKNVVINLNKMGIVVDAYYDFATGKWVGELNERTAFMIEGYAPSLRGVDANSDAKGKMTVAIAEAKKNATDRGTKIVKLREFFPRVGYDVNLGITEDRINQAASRYFLTQPTTGEAEKPAGEAEKK